MQANGAGKTLLPNGAKSGDLFSDHAVSACRDQNYDFAAAAEKIVTDAIGNTLDPGSDVRVRPHVVEGIPAQVLLDASAAADLLVVGSRGHGGFTEALLGSVSQHCVHHARCRRCDPGPGPGLTGVTITFFIALFPGSVLGLECASIFAIFTSQAWNMTFSITTP